MFYTSDTHFSHKKLVEYRGFFSIEEMNEALIERWNNKIGKTDVVYHLGDFSFANKETTIKILRRLNGRICLIKGNHDKIKGEIRQYFEWVKDYYEGKAPDGRKIVMCHYPFETWNRSHHGSYCLHGHSHNSLESNDPGSPKFRNIKRMDVGVDTNNLFPYHIDEIVEFMSKRGFDVVDHHGKERK